ncbi:SET domain-containing protein 5 [Apiospora arundinis]
MVGRSWSDAEEAYFWRQVVPFSGSRVGIFLPNQQATWDELADRMTNHFGANARRTYSGTVLYEHWFLNMRIRTRSPNAEPHLSRYFRRAGVPSPYAIANNGGGQGRGRGRGQAAAAHAGPSGVPSAPVADNSGATASQRVQGVAGGFVAGPAPGPAPPARQPRGPAPIHAPAGSASTALGQPRPVGQTDASVPSGASLNALPPTPSRTLPPSARSQRAARRQSGLPATIEQRRQAGLATSASAPSILAPSQSNPPRAIVPAATSDAAVTASAVGSVGPHQAQSIVASEVQHSRTRARTRARRTSTQNVGGVNYVDPNESSTSDDEDIPARLPRRI